MILAEKVKPYDIINKNYHLPVDGYHIVRY
jgi:hypothetical protein